MVLRIISGGQTGVDTAALRAAKLFGMETGGTIPKGSFNENGPIYKLAVEYGLKEHPNSTSYRDRTIANVEDADATLWIGNKKSPGYRATKLAAEMCEKPFLAVSHSEIGSLAKVYIWLKSTHPPIQTLNVAGHRESTSPGIEGESEAFLHDLFQILRFDGQLSWMSKKKDT